MNGFESTDLGDMLEIRCYDPLWATWRFRWDTADHRTVPSEHFWRPDDVNAYPKLEAMRQQARARLRVRA